MRYFRFPPMCFNPLSDILWIPQQVEEQIMHLEEIKAKIEQRIKTKPDNLHYPVVNIRDLMLDISQQPKHDLKFRFSYN